MQRTGISHQVDRDLVAVRDCFQLAIQYGGERQQIVALILQRHAHRSNPRRIQILAMALCNSRAGQRQSVITQPCNQRAHVFGQMGRLLLSLTCTRQFP